MMSLRCILALLALLLACSVVMPVVAAEASDSTPAADPDIGVANAERADLQNGVFEVASYPGEGRTFSVKNSVKNDGSLLSGWSGAFTVTFTISADQVYDAADPVIGSRSYDRVLAGTTSGEETTTVTVPDSVPGGTYYVMMIIDSGQTVDEDKEYNNNAIAPSQVTIGKSVDLWMQTFNPPSGTVERTFAIPNAVGNGGSDSAGAFTTGFYISTDTTWDAQDPRIGLRESTGVSPQGTTPVESTIARVPASVPAGTYYVAMFTDCWGSVAELNEYNNVYFSTAPITINGPGDLVPATFNPPTGAVERTFAIPNSVRNLGPGSVPSFKAGFFISSDTTLDSADTLIGERTFAPLAPGTTSPVENSMVTIPASIDAGTFSLLMVVVNNIPEANVQNNIAVSAGTITVATLPDLTPASFNPTFDNRSFTIRSTVANQGGSAAGPFTVGYYLSSDGTITTQDILIATRQYDGLLAGGTDRVFPVIGTVPGTVAAGPYYVGMIVDINNEVAESIESGGHGEPGNNVTSSPRPIQIPGTPDLWIQAFSGDYGQLTGREFTVSGNLRNLGDANAGAFTAGVYLSKDTVITEDDYLVKTLTFASLPAGNDAGIPETTVTIPASVPAGTYRPLLFVDKDSVVTESDETNNVHGYFVNMPPPIPPSYYTITFGDPVVNPLTASFTAAPNPVALNTGVTFTSTVVGGTAPYTYAWAFGDGATSTAAHPVHAYTTAGDYTVTLTVRDSAASPATATATPVHITFSAAVMAVPGGAGLPTDTNGDGLYDDVNGNGNDGFEDVVLLFNQLAWIKQNEPIAAFDFNGNGGIDFADVVWLFHNVGT